MRTSIKHIVLALVMCLAVTACTHNHGEINGWFGTWAIDNITNTTSEGATFTYFMQFQANVVCLRYTDTLHNGGESYGQWDETTTGDGKTTMEITFNGNYDVTILPKTAVYTVTVHSGKHATLTTTDSEGNPFTIHLTKL
ncbi:MAG: hypothetical protein J5565_03470 [Muribaculaceae bacterium]|nr:hypothetical protein [Muribaculaceae bacterium]